MTKRGARHPFLLSLTAILLLTAGCNMFAPPTAVQTLSADRLTQWTQVAALRATATAQTERLRVTLDFAQTAVSNAGVQSTRIAATMLANGTPFVDTRFITAEAPIPAAFATAPPGGTGPVVSLGQGGAQGNIPLQPPTPTPPPIQVNVAATPDPTQPSLTGSVVAQSVGADDCAIAPAATFPTTVTELFVVAVAANLRAGSPISARWQREGVEQVRYDWTPDFDIQQGCIWFRMPASDVTLSAGNWGVQLDLNGQPVGTPIAFTLTGDAMSPITPP